MREYTPTPWTLCHHLQDAEKDASCKCGYRGSIWGDNSELLVCEMRNCDLHEGHDMIPVGDRATQLANAAFIVKAVNGHEALVKALEFYADSRRYMGANQRNETSDPFSPGPYLQDVTRDGGDIARQALRDHAGGGA